MWRVTKQGSKWYAIQFKEDFDGGIPEEELENIKELLSGGDVVILGEDLGGIKYALDLDEDEDEIEVVDPED
jgi:hypothetical protein